MATKRPCLQFTNMNYKQTAKLRRLWHSVYAAETSSILIEQLGI